MNITPRLQKAIEVATVAHRNQRRKGSNLPYIAHSFSVMCIAATETEEEDVLIAALFHDILEDVPHEYSREQMLAEFGPNVVDIVDGVTKNSSIKDWRDRSEDYLANLRKSRIESVIVAVADKIHNLEATLTDRFVVGDDVWLKFNAGKEDQYWWYEQLARIFEERIPSWPLTLRIRSLVEQGLKGEDKRFNQAQL